jgi:nitrite reductase (NADH) small subunit
MGAAQSGRVGVVGEAQNRDIGIRVGDLVRIDSSDVRDDEIRRVDAVDRDEVVTGKKTLELAAEVEVDARQQDRRHVTRLTLAILMTKRWTRVVTLGLMAEAEFRNVARAEDIPPGTITTVQVDEQAIALANVGGEFFATQHACLHLQGPLGEGRLDGAVLSCPWHGWQYDVRTGENEFDRAIQLQTFEVKVENGEVKIAI